MRLYLSGMMEGVEDQNYPLFHEHAAILRQKNHVVYNPAENFGGIQTLPKTEYMRMDFAHEMLANAVCVLPGWRNSEGSRAEVLIARLIGLPVMTPEFDRVDDQIKTIPEGI